MAVISRKPIAKGRTRLAAVLREAAGLVGIDHVTSALGVDRTEAAKILARWTQQGWLNRVRRGLYAPIPLASLSREPALSNPWVLVPQLFAPGYVGGWSAAEHWDLTEQVFRDVCVFTTRIVRGRNQKEGGVSFSVNRISASALFGTTVVWEGRASIQISDVHKTLVDVLDRPVTGGGIRHVDACLDAYLRSNARSLDTLIGYAERLGSGAVFKRLGFLLSLRPDTDPAVLAACESQMSSGNAKLDPALDCTRLVTRWRLWVPRSWKVRTARDRSA